MPDSNYRKALAEHLARKIAELTIERRTIEFEKADYRLSETRPFGWRRNLPPLVAEKTIFNFVATYNDFERHFAEFLDKATDVLCFAALGTTEQGDSGSQFRVDYLKPSGAVGFYHPDWVVVQKTEAGELSWIIETKGRVWEGTAAKDEAIASWCERVSEATGTPWRYVRVNQWPSSKRGRRKICGCPDLDGVPTPRRRDRQRGGQPTPRNDRQLLPPLARKTSPSPVRHPCASQVSGGSLAVRRRRGQCKRTAP